MLANIACCLYFTSNIDNSDIQINGHVKTGSGCGDVKSGSDCKFQQ